MEFFNPGVKMSKEKIRFDQEIINGRVLVIGEDLDSWGQQTHVEELLCRWRFKFRTTYKMIDFLSSLHFQIVWPIWYYTVFLCQWELAMVIVRVKNYIICGTPMLVRVAIGLSKFQWFRDFSQWWETMFSGVFGYGESKLTWGGQLCIFRYFMYVMSFSSSC